MGSSKPVVEIDQASIIGNQLTGIVYDHPVLGEDSKGYPVVTSTIVSHKENIVETRNTIYKVKSWGPIKKLDTMNTPEIKIRVKRKSNERSN